MNKTITLSYGEIPPENYTGDIIWEMDYSGTTIKESRLDGKIHKIDGPAQVDFSGLGPNIFRIEGVNYSYIMKHFDSYYKNAIFLGKEKGRYDLEWLKFLTEEGIREIPIIPGMENEKTPSNFIARFVDLKGKNEK